MCLLCLPWYMRDCSGDQRLVTGLHRLLGPGLTHTLNLRTAAACMGRRRAAARGSRARRRCARPPTRRWCRARWPRATTSSSPAPPRAPRCTGRSSLRWRCPGARLLRHRPPVTLPPAQRLPCPKLQGPWILSRAQRPSAGRRQLPRGAACRSRACRAAAPGQACKHPARTGSASAPPGAATLCCCARSAHSGQLPALCIVAALALGAWAAAAASVDACSRGLPRALDSVLHTLHVAG